MKNLYILLLLFGIGYSDATDYLPTGLSPGDTFQLIFVTSETYLCHYSYDTEAPPSGLSTQAHYHSLAQASWHSSSLRSNIETFLGVTSINFKAVVSTDYPVSHAYNNAPVYTTTKGIYRLDGLKMANGGNNGQGAGNLYGTSQIRSISIDENGNTRNTTVYTGSDYNGSDDADAVGDWYTAYTNSYGTTFDWVDV